MGLLVLIIVGGIAGWLANMAFGTKRQGCLMNVALGVAGAVIGGFIFNLLGGVGVTGLNIWSIIVAFVGAAILLSIVKAFSPK